MKRSTKNLFSHLNQPEPLGQLADAREVEHAPNASDAGSGAKQNELIKDPNSYWYIAQRPLQSLMFLLPLIFVYELGALQFATNIQAGQTEHIVARNMLQDLMLWLGVGVPSIYLPGGLMVIVLLVWHWLRDDPWRIDFGACGLMISEAILLSLPILILGLLIHRFTDSTVDPARMSEQMLQMSNETVGSLDQPETWKQEMILSVGAGLYEELLFRLLGIGVLNAVLIQLVGLDKESAAISAVMLCAIAFGLYHFPGLVSVRWWPFFFYTVAGVYFGYIFMLRGFGIVVAVHALYDIWVAVQKYGMMHQ